jgi:hypothetical protein
VSIQTHTGRLLSSSGSSPEGESSLLLKRSVCIFSDDGKCPNTHQWYFAIFPYLVVRAHVLYCDSDMQENIFESTALA